MSNYIYTKPCKPIEKIERSESKKLDLNIFRKRTSATTPAGLILSYAKEFKKQENPEMALFCQELYKKIFAMEQSEKIKIDSWKGKSGLSLIEHPEKFICVTYRKLDKGEKPIEIKKEITKDEVNKVIRVLNSFDTKEKIPTSVIAESYYGENWKKVFSNRQEHISLVYILNILEKKEYIRYSRRGFTTILNQTKIPEIIKELKS